MHKKELGSKGASKENIKGLSDEILYKIDIPANRYDMLCLEGIARALNIFNRRIRRVDYRLANVAGEPPFQIAPTTTYTECSMRWAAPVQPCTGLFIALMSHLDTKAPSFYDLVM